MKRLLMILMAAVLVLGGCSGKSGDIAIGAHEAAEKILDGVSFKDSLIEAKGDIAKEWYRFDDNVKDFAVYVSGSGGTAEEIAVIKSSDVKTAGETIQKRIDDLKFRFENYVPEEMTKLGDPVIVTKGDTVVMVLTDDTQSARKIVDELLK